MAYGLKSTRSPLGDTAPLKGSGRKNFKQAHPPENIALQNSQATPLFLTGGSNHEH